MIASELTRDDLVVLRDCALVWRELLERASWVAGGPVGCGTAPRLEEVAAAIGAAERALGRRG